MKKLTLILALAQAAVFAQTGLLGGKTGLHQQDANTLGFFHFRLGTGGTIATDNWGYTRGALFTDRHGRTQELDVWDARMEKGRIDGALAGNFNFAFGLRDDLDIGVSLPIYYDHAKDYSGEAIRAHMGKGGLGDLQFYAKYRTPHLFGPDYMTTAAVVDLTVPTGWRGVGIRPRHAWFLDNEGGPTYAYTANSVMLGLTGIVSVDYTKKGVPLVWNSSLGLMLGFGDASNTLVYSTGVNWLVNDYFQPFLEFSGEMRFGNDAYPFSPITDPMVLTPGINVKIPFFNIDFAAGIDIGIGNLVDGYDRKDAMDNCKDFQIKYKGETGYRASYCYVAQPLIAGIAKLTWTFGFDGDDDNDGVKNRKDKCPETFPPIVVDEDGCGIDTDEDKVFDGLDKCPDTPKGVAVDSVNIPRKSSPQEVSMAALSEMRRRIAGRKRLPDLFLFTDDYLAQGALVALAVAGVRIPEDVAVVTHANKGLGPVWVKPLSRLEMDPGAHGRAVSEAVVGYLKTGMFPPDLELGSVWKTGETF